MTSLLRSHRALRILAVGATVVLAVGVLAVPALAGDTRVLYIGTRLDLDADVDGVPDNNGVLLPTPVSQGGNTKIDITVLSGDNQTVAHSVLHVPKNGDTLPSGLTVLGVLGPDAADCEWVVGGDKVVCDFGNIAGYDRRDVSIIVAVSAEFSPAATNLFSANVETNNENGDNNQIFAAYSGGFTVTAYNPDSLSTFVPPGQANKSYATGAPGGSNRLQTTVTFTSQDTGNLVQISEATTGAPACPDGLECQPDFTTVDIDGGTATFAGSPFLTWQLNALVPGTFNVNKAFVAHYPGTSATADWVLYWKNRGDRCGSDIGAAIAASPFGACLQSVTLGRTERATGLAPLQIVFVSDHNGKARY